MYGFCRVLALTLSLVCGVCGCKPNPKVAIVGEWKLIPGGQSGGGMLNGMMVDITDEGKFTIKSSPYARHYGAVDRLTGTYNWTGDYELKVSLDNLEYDYRNERMTIQVISKNELIISARDRDEVFTLTRR